MAYAIRGPYMEDVAVSVVIPAYDSAGTIERAVDSALDQTVEELEVIVVNDGSSDDTRYLVRSYDDSRVRYFGHSENRGGSAARNTGITHANGEFLAFLDADDEWEPTKLERQIEALRERSEEWIAVYCGYKKIPEDFWSRVHCGMGAILGSSIEQSEGGAELVDEVLLGNFALGGSSTLVVETAVVEEMDGFDEAFPRHQDWEFLIRLLKRGNIALVDEPLVLKYEDISVSPEDLRRAKALFFEKFRDEIGDLELEGHDVVGQHMFNLSRLYLQDGQFKEGFHYLRRSKTYNDFRLTPLAFSIGMGITSLAGQTRPHPLSPLDRAP